MKTSAPFWTILVIGIFTKFVESFENSNNSCYDAIQKYLSDAAPFFNTTDKSLSFKIENGLFLTECGTTEVLVELWRVISKPKIDRPKNFGSAEYFFKDQHCENPNPDLLAKHGQSKAASLSQPVVVFEHVVEQEYMIRLCPCLLTHCSCETISPGSQICSKVLRVNNTEEDQVFPWCRGLEQSAQAPQPKIDSPIIQHCPAQLKITGVIPSCTAVRHYDQVEVILQAVQGHPTTCLRPLQEMIKSNGIESIVRLHALNLTHGSFDVDIKNVTHDVYYCVRVELVNHPYCNSGSDASLNRQTKICRPALCTEPIYIASRSCGPAVPCTDNSPNLPLISGASLAAALLLAVGLVLLHRMVCRRPLTNPDKAATDRLLSQFPAPQFPDVFFLYFTDSEQFLAVNRLVVRWLNDLGHRVIDLSDDIIQEELISCPETWITNKLEDPNTKVVVVNSDLANDCLSSTETYRLPSDNMSGLRVFSLKHIQQRLATNYRRLAIIQYRLEVSSCLSPLVPHTRHLLPDHLAELQAWLAETHGWDDNDNMESTREQTLRDLKAAVQKYTSNHDT